MIEGIDLRRVRWLANRYARMSPACIDADDLSQIGLMEGLKARSRFDPARTVNFMTYVNRRIEGAMQDSIRTAVVGSRGKGGVVCIISMNDLDPADAKQVATLEASVDDPTEEILDRLAVEVGKLPPREKWLLIARYSEGVTQKELARKLGITEGRLSQIIRAIRETLRLQLCRLWDLP